MHIAGDLCVYTNHTTVMEILYKDLPISVNLTNPSDSIKQLMLFAGQQYIESTEGILMQDGALSLNDSRSVTRYLCRKFMPKLLGRSPAELGLAEMISVVHDTRPLSEVMELLGSKDFFCGKEPTFIDFCVYDSLIRAGSIEY